MKTPSRKLAALTGVLCMLWFALLLSGCDGSSPNEWPAYEYVIPAERRAEAAAWITATVAAANPKSDEEPEDNIAQAEKTALKLFGVPTLGMRTVRNGVWVFIPADDLPANKKDSCLRWAHGRRSSANTQAMPRSERTAEDVER
jgi:hypothetical protein